MLKNQYVLNGLLWLFLAGCQSNQRSETIVQSSQKPDAVATLEKDILATHDSIMPNMSDLLRLKKAVTKQLAESDHQPPTVEVTQRKKQGMAVSRALTRTDEAMMAWMNGYNGDTLGKLDQEKAIAYLKDQQQKVNALRQLIRKSIADAETYLK